MNENPYFAPAEHVLQANRSWNTNTGHDRAHAMTQLLIALGSMESTPQNGILPPDPGAVALIGLCLFLKRHGGTIAAMTDAHTQLHQG